MDYDENDFQSKSLRLAGEGSTEFSPVIRPYALPKFDFCDSLQGHPRFDSLVETEVFLGIESQEDNHWIEDFSRGSSAIEFSPRAVESCSISRRNNAWSEATSSESVEMLLKSVGQEEMIPEQAMKESDVHDEQGNLTKHMEPSLERQDDNALPIVANIVDSGPTSPSEKFLGSFPQLNVDVGANPMQIDESLQTHEGESSARTAGHHCDLPATGVSLLDGSKCTDVNVTEVNFSIGDFPVTHTDVSASEADKILSVGNLVTSTQNIITSIGEASSQEALCRISGSRCDSMHICNYVGGVEHVLSDKSLSGGQRLGKDASESHINDRENTINVVSGVDSILERNAEENTSKSSEEPSLMMKEESDQRIAEGHEVSVCSSIPVQASNEVMGFPKNEERNDQYKEDASNDLPVALEGDIRPKDQGLEIHSSSVNNCAQYSQGSVVEKNVNLLRSGHQMGTNILDSKSEASLLAEKGFTTLHSQSAGSDINHVENAPHSTLSCPSPELLVRRHNTGNFEDLHSSSGICRMELHSGDQTSSPALENPMHAVEKIAISQQTGVHDYDRDNSVFGKGEAELLTDASDMKCQGASLAVTCGMLESSSLSKCSTENVVIINESKSDSPKGHKAGVSLDDGVFLPPKDGVTSDEVIRSEFSEKLPSLEVRSPNFDKDEKMGTKMLTELELGTLKGCEDRHDPHVVSRDENDASSNTEQLVCETSNQPLSVVESFKVESNSRLQAAVSKVSQKVPGELGGCPVLCDSVLKDANSESLLSSNTGDEATPASHKEALQNVSEQISKEGEMSTLPSPSSPKDSGQEERQTSLASTEDNCGQIAVLSSGGGTGCEESEKPDCGSPTVVSCIDPDLHEKQLQVGDKGSLDQNPAVSEVSDGASKVGCSVSTDLKGIDPSKDDRSFTFEVTPLPDSSERETSKSWQLFPTIQAGQISEGSHRPAVSQMDSRLEEEAACGNLKASAPGSKSADRKTGRVSGKAMGKGATKKANYRKEASPLKKPERGDKSCVVSPVPSVSSQLLQSEGMLHCGRVEPGGTKTTSTLTMGFSNLPDLNTAASNPLAFRQPFTDMQQVQLRAQILVYGSIILGAAPDEACMVSAFGASDGGRSTWENAWRACVERAHIQKALGTPETPLRSRPGVAGAQPPDLANNHGALQSRIISTPVGRANNKVTSSKVVNSMTSLSSPLWSMSTPFSDGLQSSTAMPRGAVLEYSRAFSPLHTYQTPPLRNFVGNTSWPSQAPFPVPWIAAQQTSALDAGARFSTLPVSETVRLTSVRESSAANSSGIKHVSSPMAQSGSPGSALAGISAPSSIRRGPMSPGQHSADLKPKKRKKIPASEDISHTFWTSQTQTGSVPATGVTSHLDTSVVATTPPCSMSKTDPHEITTGISSSLTPASLNIGSQDTEQSTALSEETLNKVKEARQQAEQAAAHAAVAVNHSQGVWAQLDKEKSSGLISEVEAAIASAAVAVAASASIAKAAAAAAKIASNAALQAKLMAEEALVAFGNASLSQSSGISHSDGNSSASSIIVAAREAARRRVEAASAASKQAENFDALVKAAELVAEAVSQAGKVVAMGDPVPLSQLVEAGPEGCWKLAQVSLDQVVNSNNVKRHQLNVDSVEQGAHNIVECIERPVEKIEAQTIAHRKPSTPRDSSRDSREGHRDMVDGISGSVTNSEEELRIQDGCNISDLSKTIGSVPEPKLGSAAINAPIKYAKAVETLKDDCIKEGSLVEVFKDGLTYKAAWFLANVLSLEDGKACVCHTQLSAEDGSGQLKEWVALEGEGGKAPEVRVARPLIVTGVEGTRKRQRAAMGDYIWSVGDRVDAWMKDCWREGIITETHEKDETFTVSFPALGETAVVNAWHLRPSLIWKDGKWVELFSPRENDDFSHKGDMHREKRPRLAAPAVEAIGEDKKPEESKLAALSANEKIFDVGKTSREGIRPNRPKMVQSGLRREGAGVIFGVPKPGRKRKFMDVSKHYIAGQNTKINQVSDSAKLAKILMPRGSGYHDSSRGDFRGKRVAESKLKPGRAQNISSRSATQKNKLLTSGTSTPGPDGGSLTNDLSNTENSDGHEENAACKQNLTGFGSFANSKGSACTIDVSSKRVATTDSRSEFTSKGNLSSSSGKLAKIEEDKVFTGNTGKSTSDFIEPRRSNRRIQPTSRLLEGLQSSLIISKVPSASHDRAHKGQNRTVGRGSNRG